MSSPDSIGLQVVSCVANSPAAPITDMATYHPHDGLYAKCRNPEEIGLSDYAQHGPAFAVVANLTIAMD
jgi:hypothetical protein